MIVSTRTNGYHHGALKEAALAAGAEMLEGGGVEAVNVREAARRIGVSSAAIFRHFANREALLEALAARGFELLADELRNARSSADHPVEAMGVAYVGFALSHPGRFRLMFGSGLLNRERHPDLCDAAAAAFELLKSATGTAERHDGDEAVMRWARVHGLAHLALDGLLDDVTPERVSKLLRGFGRTTG